MKKIAIIHFNPIELYPPTLNFLNVVGGETNVLDGETNVWGRETAAGVTVDVCTMNPPAGYAPYRGAAAHVRIVRAGRLVAGNPLARYLGYLRFYVTATLLLIRRRPEAVLYYETISTFPVWIYKRFVRRRARVFIHYHEYTSPGEYQGGMWLNRWQHGLERELYPLASWISHTNADRAGFFREDLAGVDLPEVRLLPNYPPASWGAGALKSAGSAGLAASMGVAGPVGSAGSAGPNPEERPLRIVYVGALSLDTMYTREFTEWVDRQEGKVEWDIYTGNISPDARAWFEAGGHPQVRLHPAVDYYQLPEVLKGYDVGVILYNGHIPNYIYNAPNKLFEYWACGLDVWLPDILKTSVAFVNTDRRPRILCFDFSRLGEFDWQQAADHTGLVDAPSPFSCEVALEVLKKEIGFITSCHA